MVANYIPNTPFNVPFWLMVPTLTTVKGVPKKTFDVINQPFYGSFKTFGGTEKVNNDVVVVEDTAIVGTWFDPRIRADCRIKINDVEYEILGTPENIDMRNQFLRFKVRGVKGGA